MTWDDAFAYAGAFSATDGAFPAQETTWSGNADPPRGFCPLRSLHRETRAPVSSSPTVLVLDSGGWESSDTLSFAAAMLSSQLLRVPARVTYFSTDSSARYRNLGTGRSHVVLEAWMTAEQRSTPFLRSNNLIVLSALGALGNSGLYVATRTNDSTALATAATIAGNPQAHLRGSVPGLATATNSTTGAAKHAVVIGAAEWDSTRDMCSGLGIIAGLGFNMTCRTHATEDAMVTSITQALATSPMVLVQTYITSPVQVMLPKAGVVLTRVRLPDVTPSCEARPSQGLPRNCDYGTHILSKMAWSGIRTYIPPRATDMLFNAFVSDAMLLSLIDHAQEAEALCSSNRTAVSCAGAGAFSQSPVALRAAACKWAGVWESDLSQWVNGLPTAVSVRPSNGSTVGGDEISIRGNNFGVVAPPSLEILVGQSPCKESRWVSATELVCVTPSGTEADMLVTVRFGARSFVAEEKFSYFKATLSALSDEAGRPVETLFAGGSVIVAGSDLGYVETSVLPSGDVSRVASAAQCRFHSTAVPAEVLSSTRVRCVVPDLDLQGGVVGVAVTADGRRWSSTIDASGLPSVEFPDLTTVRPYGFSATSMPPRIAIVVLLLEGSRGFAKTIVSSAATHVRGSHGLLPFTAIDLVFVPLDGLYTNATEDRPEALWNLVMHARREARGPILGVYTWWSDVSIILGSAPIAAAWQVPLGTPFAKYASIGWDHPEARPPLTFSGGWAAAIGNATLLPFTRRAFFSVSESDGNLFARFILSAQEPLFANGFLERERRVVAVVIAGDNPSNVDTGLAATRVLAAAGFYVRALVITASVSGPVPPAVTTAAFGYRSSGANATIIRGTATNVVEAAQRGELHGAKVIIAMESAETAFLSPMAEAGFGAPGYIMCTSSFYVFGRPQQFVNQLRGSFISSNDPPLSERAAKVSNATGVGSGSLEIFDAIVSMLVASHSVLTRELPGQGLPAGSVPIPASLAIEHLERTNMLQYTALVSRYDRGSNDAVGVFSLVLRNIRANRPANTAPVLGIFSVTEQQLLSFNDSAVQLPTGSWVAKAPKHASVAVLADFSRRLLQGFLSVSASAVACAEAERVLGLNAVRARVRLVAVEEAAGNNSVSSDALAVWRSSVVPMALRYTSPSPGNGEEVMLGVVSSHPSSAVLAIEGDTIRAVEGEVVPHVSSVSTASSLANANVFSRLFRMPAPNQIQANAFVELMRVNQWYRGLIIAHEGAYASDLAKLTSRVGKQQGIELERADVVVRGLTFGETVNELLQEVRGRVLDRDLRVIVVIGEGSFGAVVFEVICNRLQLCGRRDGAMFLLSDSLSTRLWESSGSSEVTGGPDRLRTLMRGSIGAVPGIGKRAEQVLLSDAFWGARMQPARACRNVSMRSTRFSPHAGAVAASLCTVGSRRVNATRVVVPESDLAREQWMDVADRALVAAVTLATRCNVSSVDLDAWSAAEIAQFSLLQRCRALVESVPDASLISAPGWESFYSADAALLLYTTAESFLERSISLKPRSLQFLETMRNSTVVGVGGTFSFGYQDTSAANAPYDTVNFRTDSTIVRTGTYYMTPDTPFQTCAPGTSRSAESIGCEPCKPDTYSAERGEVAACTRCPFTADRLFRTTTANRLGSVSVAACLCPTGYYLSPADERFNDTSGATYRLNETTVPEDASMMCMPCPAGFVCTQIGLELADVEVEPGWWRGHPHAIEPMECVVKDRCPKVSRVVDQGPATRAGKRWRFSTECSEGYAGPGCGSCDVGFGRGLGTPLNQPCQPCPQSWAVYLGVAGQVVYITAIMFLLLRSLSEATSIAEQRKSLNVRSLVTYLQVNSLLLALSPTIPSFITGLFPLYSFPALVQLFEVFGTAQLLWAVPMECQFSDSLAFPSMQAAIVSAMPSASIACLGLVVLTVMVTVRKWRKRRRRRMEHPGPTDENITGADPTGSFLRTSMRGIPALEGSSEAQRAITANKARSCSGVLSVTIAVFIVLVYLMYPAAVSASFSTLQCTAMPALQNTGPRGCPSSYAHASQHPGCAAALAAQDYANASALIPNPDATAPLFLATDPSMACVGDRHTLMQGLGIFCLVVLLIVTPGAVVLLFFLQGERMTPWMKPVTAHFLTMRGRPSTWMSVQRMFCPSRLMRARRPPPKTTINVMARDILELKRSALAKCRVVVLPDDAMTLVDRFQIWRFAVAYKRDMPTAVEEDVAGSEDVSIELDAKANVHSSAEQTSLADVLGEEDEPALHPDDSTAEEDTRSHESCANGADAHENEDQSEERTSTEEADEPSPVDRISSGDHPEAKDEDDVCKQFATPEEPVDSEDPDEAVRIRALARARSVRSEAERMFTFLFRTLLLNGKALDEAQLRNTQLLLMSMCHCVGTLVVESHGAIGVEEAVGLTLRHLEHCSRMHKRFGVLSQPYRDGSMYWEVMIMCRKALLSAIAVFFGAALHLRLSLGIVVLFISLVATYVVRPFINVTSEFAQLRHHVPDIDVCVGPAMWAPLRAIECCRDRARKRSKSVERRPRFDLSQASVSTANRISGVVCAGVVQQWLHKEEEEARARRWSGGCTRALNRLLGTQLVRQFFLLPLRVAPLTLEVTSIGLCLFNVTAALAIGPTESLDNAPGLNIGMAGAIYVTQIIVNSLFVPMLVLIILADILVDKKLVRVSNASGIAPGRRTAFILKLLLNAGRDVSAVLKAIARQEVVQAMTVSFPSVYDIARTVEDVPEEHLLK